MSVFSPTDRLILTLAPVLAYRDVVEGLIHHLRNPLQTIAFGARSLNENPDEATATRIRIAMTHSADRSMEMIDLLSEATETRVDTRAPSVIADVVRRVIGLQRESRLQIRGPINANLPDNIPPVSIGEHDIEMSLMMVINNAKESIGLDLDGEIEVDVRYEPPDRVRLTVTDTGGGVSGEAEDPFEPFRTTKESRKHLGLGLTATRLLLRRSGGVIGLENRDPSGGICEIGLRPWAGAGSPAP